MNRIVKSALVLAVILFGSISGFAIPTLQLNIANGTYNLTTQTIVAPTTTTNNKFKLYAYLIEDSNSGDLVTGTYFVSLALSPQVSSSAPLGSVVFNGTGLGVPGNMAYGVPPLEDSSATQPKDPGDLAPHGIFPTFFAEYQFQFNPGDVTEAFNTQDYPGLDPTVYLGTVNNPMYYHEFLVDVSNLDPNYLLHFDLYSKLTVTTQVTTYTDHPNLYVPATQDSCTNGGTGKQCTVTTTTNNPGAYVPATQDHCTNGSTAFPQCTLTTTTTQNYPSAYVAPYTTCQKGNETGPNCVDNKGVAHPQDVVNHPASCTNGSTVFPQCTLTTTTTTNNHSAFVAGHAESCTNGSHTYPTCATTTTTKDASAFIPGTAEYCTNGSNSYPLCTSTDVGFVPNGDSDINSFAPFSHDAEGGYNTPTIVLPPQQTVPEPSSLFLLGTGLLGLTRVIRRRK